MSQTMDLAAAFAGQHDAWCAGDARLGGSSAAGSTAVVSEELSDAAALSAAEDENDIVNIRIRRPATLFTAPIISWRWRPDPKNASSILPCWAPAAKLFYGCVTLMISDKLRTLPS